MSFSVLFVKCLLFSELDFKSFLSSLSLVSAQLAITTFIYALGHNAQGLQHQNKHLHFKCK
jgi:DMSO/TMAO reductase YedYZ heme-binding membrane subunit